jgi:Transcription factor S-II (TFIIS), central domain
LKAANNPELRGRVARGEIAPGALVAMSAADLASADESAWRASVVERSKKMTVLDSDAAAQFSTAAQLAAHKRLAEEREVRLALSSGMSALRIGSTDVRSLACVYVRLAEESKVP